MKKKLLYIFFIISSTSFFPQEIKWENLSAGIVINHLITQGDLKEYWNNTPEGGLLINYIIDKNLSMQQRISPFYFMSDLSFGISVENIFDQKIKFFPVGNETGRTFIFFISGGICRVSSKFEPNR